MKKAAILFASLMILVAFGAKSEEPQAASAGDKAMMAKFTKSFCSSSQDGGDSQGALGFLEDYEHDAQSFLDMKEGTAKAMSWSFDNRCRKAESIDAFQTLVLSKKADCQSQCVRIDTAIQKAKKAKVTIDTAFESLKSCNSECDDFVSTSLDALANEVIDASPTQERVDPGAGAAQKTDQKKKTGQQ